MKLETKQFAYTVWRYLLIGPLFAIPFVWAGLMLDEIIDPLRTHPEVAVTTHYLNAALAAIVMCIPISYVFVGSAALASGAYRAWCTRFERQLHLGVYYFLAVMCNLHFVKALYHPLQPFSTPTIICNTLAGVFMAYKMLNARITPKENPYAHIVAEKHSQPSVFSNIMLLYALAAPLFASLLPAFLLFTKASNATAAELPSVWLGMSIMLLLLLCTWVPGLYLARRVVRHEQIHRRIYYSRALLAPMVLPVVILLLRVIFVRPNIVDMVMALVCGGIFGIANLMLSALFLVITERWLKNTPFALQFAKKSPPVSATEN
jgi:hypothetical protein